MNAFLTAVAFVIVIAVAAYVIHRLNLQHADRIAVHRYETPLPGHRGHGTPHPAEPGRSESPATGARTDHRDEGGGRFPRRPAPPEP